MISLVGRLMVRMLPFAHVMLLAWLLVPEFTACSDMRLPVIHRGSDLETARFRASRGSYFYAAAGIDLFCMIVIVCVSSKRSGAHDLRGAMRWVPALMVASNIAFRARYTFCAPNDTECCDGLQCPISSYSTDFAGCASNQEFDSFYIDWRDRSNWCAIPKWYQTSNAATLCNGLQNTPDVASCYRYGCSTLSPERYNGVRIVIALSFLFALFSLLPYEAHPGREVDQSGADTPDKKTQ